MKLYALFVLPLFSLAVHCSDESEENQFYKNERLNDYRYDEKAVTKEAAIEIWEIFLSESQDLIVYSRDNLEAFRYQMDNANGAEKMELLRQYEISKKAIDKLELDKQQQNNRFNAALPQYDQKNQRQNKAFIKKFKREIIRINLALGCAENDHLESFEEQ